MKKILILFFGFMCIAPLCTFMQAQHASVNAAGGNATGTGGSVSYSVGQVFTTSASGTTAWVSPGVQQPFEISVATGIDDLKGIDLIYTAFPNPTKGKMTLKLEASTEVSSQTLSYQLIDVKGKILKNEILKANETAIDMAELAPSAYLLRITKKNQTVKTFKIIKN